MIFLNVPVTIKYCSLRDGLLTLVFYEYGEEVTVEETFATVADLYDQIAEYPADFMDLYNTHLDHANLPVYDRLQALSFLDGNLKEVEIVARASEMDRKLLAWKRQNPEDIRKELAHERLKKEAAWLKEKRT